MPFATPESEQSTILAIMPHLEQTISSMKRVEVLKLSDGWFFGGQMPEVFRVGVSNAITRLPLLIDLSLKYYTSSLHSFQLPPSTYNRLRRLSLKLKKRENNHHFLDSSIKLSFGLALNNAPNLEELYIHLSLSRDLLLDEIFTKISGPPLKIHTLSLNRISNMNSSSAEALLPHIQNLKHFTLNTSSWSACEGLDTIFDAFSTSEVELHSLSLTSLTARSTAINYMCSYSGLRILTLRPTRVPIIMQPNFIPAISSIGSIVFSHRDSLTNLDLFSIWNMDWAYDAVISDPIRACTQLQMLRVITTVDGIVSLHP